MDAHTVDPRRYPVGADARGGQDASPKAGLFLRSRGRFQEVRPLRARRVRGWRAGRNVGAQAVAGVIPCVDNPSGPGALADLRRDGQTPLLSGLVIGPAPIRAALQRGARSIRELPALPSDGFSRPVPDQSFYPRAAPAAELHPRATSQGRWRTEPSARTTTCIGTSQGIGKIVGMRQSGKPTPITWGSGSNSASVRS